MNARFTEKGVPPLSSSKRLRYFSFIVMYFSQGIPEGITIFGIPAWMAMNGKSAAEIASYSALIILPFSFKILLAPIMERYTFLPMGRRRPWLLFGQLGIVCSLLALSLVPDPINNITGLTIAALFVHLFIMFQDIATDSLVIDIVPLDQQGRANSLMWGSKTVGVSLSLAAGSWLINQYGFPTAIVTMAVIVSLFVLIPLLVRERAGEKLLPWTNGKTSPDAALLAIDSWRKLFKSFTQVILLRNTILLAVAIFITMAAMHYMRTMLPVFTIQELGWDNVYYSKVYSTSNLVGGILGMLVGGFLIQRLGIIRMIHLALFCLASMAVVMSFLSSFWENKQLVSGFIAIFCALLTINNIGALALAMRLCWKRISAMQFTFSMTIFNAGLATGAALLGYLRTIYDWQIIFLIFAGFLAVSVVFLKLLKIRKHREQVVVLEKNYLDILESEGKLLTQSDA
jgi:PAT family beta-lactamase induction signal transducer AmpG